MRLKGIGENRKTMCAFPVRRCTPICGLRDRGRPPGPRCVQLPPSKLTVRLKPLHVVRGLSLGRYDPGEAA